MDYLWFSSKQSAAILREREGLGYSLYLDDDGEPHKVSNVTHKPEHGTRWDDMSLVGSAEKAVWLTNSRQQFNEAARSFCASRHLEPSIDGILKYIDGRKYALDHAVKVARPLKLKIRS
jgi:hypothetical protein